MPDISMCPSTTCPMRTSCYRNEASGTRPTPRWQSYFVAREVDELGRCREYLPIERDPPPVKSGSL